MSTVQIQNDIIDDFKILDGDLEMTLNYLMELGESLNDLDEKYKIDDNLVKGCQSKVWLHANSDNGRIQLTADSDAIITKGIISLLIKVLNNQKHEDILIAKMNFINEIGLSSHLSPTRANGLLEMVKQIKSYALAFSIKKNA